MVLRECGAVTHRKRITGVPAAVARKRTEERRGRARKATVSRHCGMAGETPSGTAAVGARDRCAASAVVLITTVIGAATGITKMIAETVERSAGS